MRAEKPAMRSSTSWTLGTMSSPSTPIETPRGAFRIFGEQLFQVAAADLIVMRLQGLPRGALGKRNRFCHRGLLPQTTDSAPPELRRRLGDECHLCVRTGATDFAARAFET